MHGRAVSIRKQAVANIIIIVVAGVSAFALFIATMFGVLLVAIPYMNS